MKKFISLIMLVSIIMSVPALAGTRADLYGKFSPILLEAVVLVIKDEINILRTEVGLEPRTNQQLITALEIKLDGLELYDWMKEEIK